METLGQKRCRFTQMVALLIQHAKLMGYEVALGECVRMPSQAALNAANGVGIANSLHLIGLAVDLNLYRNSVYLPDTASHLPLGAYWETLGGSWGGRFTKPDGNHYSLEHNGVR